MTNPDMIADLIEFQKHFGQYYEGPPRELPFELEKIRIKKLWEEVNELDYALMDGNNKEYLDATVDLIYILIGSSLMRGHNIAEAWRRIHAANMTKVRSGEDIMKPEGFIPPNLEDLV